MVGYDDSTLVAFTDPPLTTVRQSVQAMGEAAVRALIDEIAGEPAPRAEYVFRPELVVAQLHRGRAARAAAAAGPGRRHQPRSPPLTAAAVASPRCRPRRGRPEAYGTRAG